MKRKECGVSGFRGNGGSNIVCVLSLLLALSSLNGCADLGKSYSEIDPEGAKADIRKHNGYFELKAVKPGMTKLVLRSMGSGRAVNFSLSTTTLACQDFEKLGEVQFSGRGVLYPWIADMVDRRKHTADFLVREFEPKQSIYVRSNGSWFESQSIPGSGMSTTSSGRCGALISKFTPQANHAYVVEFNWLPDGCMQLIEDATDPDHPVPIQAETTFACTKTSAASE